MMNFRSSALAVLVVASVAVLAHADGTDLGAIAESFIPPAIAEEVSASGDPDAAVAVVFVTARLDGPGGSEFLVAGYGGEYLGAVRVISLATEPPSLLGEIELGGSSPSIAARDVDDDGKPEIIAEFAQVRGTSRTWVLRWHESAPVNISPPAVSGDTDGTALRGAIFEDLDGDGKLEAITSAVSPGVLADGEDDPVLMSSVYGLGASGYAASSRTLYFFTRAIAGSSNREFDFALGRRDVAYRVYVTNGDADGGRKVTNGRIEVNGTTVLAPADFATAPGSLSGTFTPQAENILKWTIDAPSDGQMFVWIEPTSTLTPPAISVFVDCVWDEGNGLFTASFGYENPNPSQRSIRRGSQNGFSPIPLDRGQNVVFRPGRHEKEFFVQSSGELLAWTVEGATVAASLAHPSRCEGAAPAHRAPAVETPWPQPPVATAIAPARGLPTGGELVLVTGANLSGTTSVRFATVEATIVDRGTHFVELQAPAGGPGAVDVIITTDGGMKTLSGAYTYATPWPTASPGSPKALNAAANGTSVLVSWSPGIAADQYEIQRKLPSGAWIAVGAVAGSVLEFTDMSAGSDGMALYRVSSIAKAFPETAGSATSIPSKVDFANLRSFTYEVLTASTKIKAQHVIELRRAVNALRAAVGLFLVYDESETTLASLMGMRIRADHFNELLARINDVRTHSLFDLTEVSFADLPAVSKTVKRAELQRLREALE